MEWGFPLSKALYEQLEFPFVHWKAGYSMPWIGELLFILELTDILEKCNSLLFLQLPWQFSFIIEPSLWACLLPMVGFHSKRNVYIIQVNRKRWEFVSMVVARNVCAGGQAIMAFPMARGSWKPGYTNFRLVKFFNTIPALAKITWSKPRPRTMQKKATKTRARIKVWEVKFWFRAWFDLRKVNIVRSTTISRMPS